MPTRDVLKLTLLVLASGCGKPDSPPPTHAHLASHEAVVEAAIASLKTAAGSMNGASDDASAEQALKTLPQEMQILESLQKRLSELGNASAGERERVKEHGKEFLESSKEVKIATAELLGKGHTGRFSLDVAQRLAAASGYYQQAMVAFGKQATPLFE